MRAVYWGVEYASGPPGITVGTPAGGMDKLGTVVTTPGVPYGAPYVSTVPPAHGETGAQGDAGTQGR